MLGKLARTIMSNKMSTLNVGFSAMAGMDTYQSSREEGKSVAGAALSAGFDVALSALNMPLYLGYEAVTSIAPAAIEGGLKWRDSAKRDIASMRRQKAFSGAQFNDTEQAYTMRQAGMAIAQRSKYNTQQAMLGNEAKYMMK